MRGRVTRPPQRDNAVNPVRALGAGRVKSES